MLKFAEQNSKFILSSEFVWEELLGSLRWNLSNKIVFSLLLVKPYMWGTLRIPNFKILSKTFTKMGQKVFGSQNFKFHRRTKLTTLISVIWGQEKFFILRISKFEILRLPPMLRNVLWSKFHRISSLLAIFFCNFRSRKSTAYWKFQNLGFQRFTSQTI
jgi:hypothetical protein